ncbi:unnamed protein product [Toxocara canis]|uniref:Uncharacterized protein n=1 Tax=Toxocara canis TaxID=6265 RepID=A0A183U693_TOXCA|nr:unnamed protein product [Toxocara canis]
MLGELTVKSAIAGLRIIISRTKVMSNGELKSELYVRGEQIESTKEFIYVGKCVKMREGTQRKLFDKIGLLAFLNCSETLATTEQARIPLAAAYRRMERTRTGTNVVKSGTNKRLRRLPKVMSSARLELRNFKWPQKYAK